MDAIESGIVKLPRIPVADNMPNSDTLTFRNLWDHIGKRDAEGRRPKAGKGDPRACPPSCRPRSPPSTATTRRLRRRGSATGIDVPPVFIVVCNNTSTSQLIYEWIAGFERETRASSPTSTTATSSCSATTTSNGQRLARPNTLLIDSEQLESGEALDKNFRDMAAPEIEQFRRERATRMGAAEAADITDQDLLREVMNTVGRKGRLGERIRCVVSVSMLTEGWDTNTVTHILGVRAFGTQLLCEQVVGRGLRRQSYDLNADGLFDAEYADILGIPFDFAAQPSSSSPPSRPSPAPASRPCPPAPPWRSPSPASRATASTCRTTGSQPPSPTTAACCSPPSRSARCHPAGGHRRRGRHARHGRAR